MNSPGFKNQCSRYINYPVTIMLICFSGFTHIVKAQAIYKSTYADVKVLGTSNLHDWSMETKDVYCRSGFHFSSAGTDQPSSLANLSLSLVVGTLKSGETLMDTRAYNALKAQKFRTIDYVLSSATIVPVQKNQFIIKSLGSLTIAGVTRQVSLDVNCSVSPDGSITCTGSEKVEMTDYGIKPPSFMFGALKTGNDLTIGFTLVLNK